MYKLDNAANEEDRSKTMIARGCAESVKRKGGTCNFHEFISYICSTPATTDNQNKGYVNAYRASETIADPFKPTFAEIKDIKSWEGYGKKKAGYKYQYNAAKLLDPSLHIPNMKHGDVIEKLTDIVQSARRTYANADAFGSHIVWGLQNAHSSRVAEVNQYMVIALQKEAETDPDLKNVVVKTSQKTNPNGLTYEVYDSPLTIASSKANGFQVLNAKGVPMGVGKLITWSYKYTKMGVKGTVGIPHQVIVKAYQNANSRLQGPPTC